jgi:hypothetical protein
MSFGLKNASATYQRAIQACLNEQISHNAEAYVDDVVVKTQDSATLIDDLKGTFKTYATGSGGSTQTSASSVYLLDSSSDS